MKRTNGTVLRCLLYKKGPDTQRHWWRKRSNNSGKRYYVEAQLLTSHLGAKLQCCLPMSCTAACAERRAVGMKVWLKLHVAPRAHDLQDCKCLPGLPPCITCRYCCVKHASVQLSTLSSCLMQELYCELPLFCPLCHAKHSRVRCSISLQL